MTREEKIKLLRSKKNVPVLIVGAGVNGVGVYRELALQGITTLLVDKADISAGASAASSRMIHGGLRYLENNEVKLVKESLAERNGLLLNAPHYVKPLPTTIPIFSRFSGVLNALPKFFGISSRNIPRGALLVKLGLVMYDFFTRKQRILPKHSFSGKGKSLEKRPQLHPEIVNTATYYDAWISYPERLCLELVQDTDALKTASMALNYVSLSGQKNSRTVLLKDETSDETFEIRPKVLINATGAWIDFTNQAVGQKTKMIGGTKGSHLVVDNKELMDATQGHMLFYENKDGRICILFPFQGKVLVGSTDIKINDPEMAICQEDEVNYMLEAVKQIFPSINIAHSEVVFQFCGVRPLPNSDATVTAQITRDHQIKVIEPSPSNDYPIYNLIGGKWTTFRAFAEQTTDKVLQYLNFPRKLTTNGIPIGGGKNYPKKAQEIKQWIANVQRTTKLPYDRIEQLLERYGTTAALIAGYLVERPDNPLVHHSEYSQREIQYMLEHEYVVYVDDILLRRTTITLKGELTLNLLKEIVGIMAECRKWTKERMSKEVERTLRILSEKHNVKLK